MSTLKVKCSVCNSFNAFNSVLSCKHEICLKCSKRGCPKCLRENP